MARKPKNQMTPEELEVQRTYFREYNKKRKETLSEEELNKRKEITKQRNKEYKDRNKEILKQKRKEYTIKNKDKVTNNWSKWYQENKDKRKEYTSKYYKEKYSENAEKIKKRKRDYYQRNKETINKKARDYNKINRNLINEYKNEKRKTDKLYNLKHVVGCMIRRVLKNKGHNKSYKTQQILGCTFEEFKQHLESQFEPWMNWDNYGKYNGEFNFGWDIDHVIPVSFGTNEQEIMVLNHYTNLKPLCSKVNRHIKSNKV